MQLVMASWTLVLLVLAGVLTGLTGCQSPPATVEPLMIGTPPLESSALIYVAQDQGYFAANGLDVSLRGYDTGAASLAGLVNGEVDVAVPAEYALVGRAFNRDKVRIIASIDKAEYFHVIARLDRGIKSIQDLKGKRIGVVKSTIAEFYLSRFLEQHSVATGQVTLVDVNISQSDAAIQTDTIDAIITRPPYAGPIQEHLGANAVIWQAQGSQALYAILISRNDWIAEHSEGIRRLYRSLIQAEEYLNGRPNEARTIVQKQLHFDDAYMDAVWSQNQFSLSLDQSLIVAMEDEARWMIKNNLTGQKQVPDFLDYVHDDTLKAVKPEAVNIIR